MSEDPIEVLVAGIASALEESPAALAEQAQLDLAELLERYARARAELNKLWEDNDRLREHVLRQQRFLDEGHAGPGQPVPHDPDKQCQALSPDGERCLFAFGHDLGGESHSWR